MTRYALCVGINEFKSLPRSSWLSGCVNDANDISKALKKLGFTARNITVLRDKEATKKKVMAALTDDGRARRSPVTTSCSRSPATAPRCRAMPGDPDEPDGLDEAFACYDIKRTATLGPQDRDRRRRAARPLRDACPRGCCVEVLLDTCHSGTGLKDLDDIQQAMLLGRRPRFLPPPTPQGARTAPATIRAATPRDGRPQVARRADQDAARHGEAGAVRRLPSRPDRVGRDLRQPPQRRVHLPVPQGARRGPARARGSQLRERGHQGPQER